MSDDIKKIKKIININDDARDFYREAREKAQDTAVQEVFKKYEQLHHGVVTNLQDYVSKNGGDTETDGTLTGEIKEMWGKARAAISPNVDESLIASLEEAEDRCIHSIKDAIADDGISPAAKIALKKEEEILQKTHDYMKIMKDNVNIAA